jgi:hypothetical protein
MRPSLQPLAALALISLAPPALADLPEVLRGGADREAPIVVVRGTGSTAFPAAVPPAEPLPWMTAGRHLWVIDPTAERIVGCRLEPTTQVERDRVRCTEAARGAGF